MFKSPDQFGPLRGQLARVAWHSSRWAVYATFGVVMGQIFFGSYALSTGLAGRALDPRLKEFSEAIKRRQQEGRGNVREEMRRDQQQQRQEMEGPREGETQEMARQRRDSQGLGRSRGQQRQVPRREKKAEVDDMSPTGGAFEDDFMGQTGSDTGVVDDTQMRGQQTNTSVATTIRSASTQQQQQRPSSPNQQAGGGSSWERIRQNARSGSDQTPSTRSSTGSPAGSDSFSFSQDQEDRQLARGEAQKEFDNRVEREREGRDFEEGSRSGGWRR